MSVRSSTTLVVALCAATLVSLDQRVVVAEQPQAAPQTVQVDVALDLSPEVGVPSCATGLNALGTVVGIRREYGIERGFSRSAAGALVTLEPDTYALAVNDRGEIAGQGNVSGSGLGARVWTAAGMQAIAIGVAYSLNNRTEVVGFHMAPSTVIHGFVWSAAEGLTDVESLTGETPPWYYFAPQSITRFIRADGVMAGERGGFAVLWQPDGRVTTLGPGVANSVNDRDVAVGATRLSDGYPVVWRDGSPTIIAEVVGEAKDVNGAGYVVGWLMAGGERHAFVWHADHGLIDLGPGEARDIDEMGAVAGCRGLWNESLATVWQVAMTDAEYLVGFESLAWRLLADVDAKASRKVFHEITLAQKALDRPNSAVAARHLQRAIDDIAALADAGALPADWAALLQRTGEWIVQRL